MTTAVKNLFGNGNAEEVRAAQQRQEAMIAEDRRRLQEVEDGQIRARNGGRGLLAFLDPESDLSRVLGGSGKAGEWGRRPPSVGAR